MGASFPRPIGRKVATKPTNTPGGWLGYVLARPTPQRFTLPFAPPAGMSYPQKRHGNDKHGGRSKSGIATMRLIGACKRLLPTWQRDYPAVMLPCGPVGWPSCPAAVSAGVGVRSRAAPSRVNVLEQIMPGAVV